MIVDMKTLKYVAERMVQWEEDQEERGLRNLRNEDDHLCVSCEGEFSVDIDNEPGPLCNRCAYDVTSWLPELMALIESLEATKKVE